MWRLPACLASAPRSREASGTSAHRVASLPPSRHRIGAWRRNMQRWTEYFRLQPWDIPGPKSHRLHSRRHKNDRLARVPPRTRSKTAISAPKRRYQVSKLAMPCLSYRQAVPDALSMLSQPKISTNLCLVQRFGGKAISAMIQSIEKSDGRRVIDCWSGCRSCNSRCCIIVFPAKHFRTT